MKALYLLSGDGSFRRASSSQIAAVLDGRDQAAIARLSVSDDGEATSIALSPDEIAALREGIEERRAADLTSGLDRLLETVRRLEDIVGVSFGYSSVVMIDLEEAPWAESVVRGWAARNSLAMKDEGPPGSAPRWRRQARVDLGPDNWSRTVVTLTWPTVSIVARDAELEGRTEDAARINAETF